MSRVPTGARNNGWATTPEATATPLVTEKVRNPREARMEVVSSITVSRSSTTIGAAVSGVDLASGIGDADAETVKDALDERGVLIFEGQHAVDDEAQERIASLWAVPRPHPVVELMGSTDVIGVVYNDADHPPKERSDATFHTDYSFNHEIPDVAVLRTVLEPPTGGATAWADARAALATLDDEEVRDLRGRVAHHDMGPGFRAEMEARFGS